MPVDQAPVSIPLVHDWRKMMVIAKEDAHCEDDCVCRDTCRTRNDFAEGVPIERYQHKPTDFIGYKENKLDPATVMIKSRTIIAELQKPKPVKLTVGDLSIVSGEKNTRERIHQRLRAKEQGLSIGDLSPETACKDSVECQVQRIRAQEAGLTVGSLFVGAGAPESATSESQKLLMDMQSKQREKRNEVDRMKVLIRRMQEAGGLLHPWEVASILRGAT